MDRRSFLKQASAYALATTWTMTNLEQIFAATPPAKEMKQENQARVWGIAI